VSDTINIFATAKPSTADAGSDQFLCTESGITTSLSAATPAIGTGTWNIISGSGGVNNPQSAVSQVEGLIPGSTTLVWIVQNGVCPPSSDTLLIVVGNSDLSADAGSDVSIFQGESTNLNASGNGAFSWSPADGLSCIDCQNPTATPMTSTVYYLTVTSDEGCKQTDSIVVTIDLKKDWFIPSAFSPNNDGHNDVLYLRGYGIKSFSLQVFDRWGAMVFKTEDLSNGWDGNYQSKPASSGVYHWVLSLSYESGELVEQKGNITLAR
jgi:gliding motility-associated-like protein